MHCAWSATGLRTHSSWILFMFGPISMFNAGIQTSIDKLVPSKSIVICLLIVNMIRFKLHLQYIMCVRLMHLNTIFAILIVTVYLDPAKWRHHKVFLLNFSLIDLNYIPASIKSTIYFHLYYLFHEFTPRTGSKNIYAMETHWIKSLASPYNVINCTKVYINLEFKAQVKYSTF